MEDKEVLSPGGKKRGRKKGQKARPVMAVHKDTFEFFGIFPSSGQAAFVLLGNRDMGQAVSKCAKGEYRKVREYSFAFVDMEKGLTAELIKEVTEQVKSKLRDIAPMCFTTEILLKMDGDELKILKSLYAKYGK